MHAMNNTPSPFTANYTPNQLFIDAPPDDASALIDSKQLATVVDNEFVAPRTMSLTTFRSYVPF